MAASAWKLCLLALLATALAGTQADRQLARTNGAGDTDVVLVAAAEGAMDPMQDSFHAGKSPLIDRLPV